MNMKNISVVFLGIFWALQIATTASAKSPWKWQLSLIGKPPNNLMQQPTALYVDAAKKRYYVVDSGNNRLVSFDKDGKFLNAFNAQGNLKTPTDFTRDKEGKLWVVEKGRNSITMVNLRDKITKPHELKNNGVPVYPDRFEFVGDLFYVLDRSSGNVLSFNKHMKVVKRYGCSDCNNGFIDFTIHKGNVWGLGLREKAVYGFSPTGEQTAKIKLDNEAVNFPRAITFDSSGFLYVLDRYNGSVAVFDTRGRLKYSFLSKGHVREKLFYPVEIRFDPWGRLCVVDEGNGRVEIFSR